MQKEYETRYHLLEEQNWWFMGRRHLVRSLVIQNCRDKNCQVLEIGCSGGVLLKQLQADGYVHLTGIDISADAVGLCQQRGLADTHLMDAQEPSFGNASYDAIIASDVLEHLANAPKALREWSRLLRPGGVLIVFVPAFMLLWSQHDEENRHFRRFNRAELVRLLSENGFSVRRTSYWNFCLFFPVALIRLLRRGFKFLSPPEGRGDLTNPPRVINSLLLAMLRLENHLIRVGVNWPWGVSVMALAQKARLPEQPSVPGGG